MSKSILIVPILWFVVDAARILGVFPDISYSHQVAFRPLMMELSQRGHDIIIFTTFPMNNSTLQNYTEVELCLTSSVQNINIYSINRLSELLRALNVRSVIISDETLSHPVMQRLISPNSGEKFDLIIVQSIFYDSLYALSVRFNAPIIAISSIPLLSWQHFVFGNPLLAAYSPNSLTNLDENMNLWERFVNLYSSLYQIYWYWYELIPAHEKISRKHFGDSVPPVHQLISNITLLLSNFHPFIYPRANIPAIIPISGYRPVSQKEGLPQDLEKILNDAKQGYVYFSLGSNIKSNTLSDERRNMLLRAFAKLPYKVLWKFESEFLPDKPNNVIIRKWLPQQEILAHPNIRLFVYQGGLQSTEEAIGNGVPVIGFPFFADQFYNVKMLLVFTTGKMLSFKNTNEDEFRAAILEVITNSSYKENMLKMRDLLRDLPYDPLDNAVWWTEHVIRHKGAPHLRNKSRDMPWYQILLLDIMAVVIGAIILVVLVIIVFLAMIKRYLFRINKQLLPAKKRPMHNAKKQQ
ncbi:UDP-glycosyltransferase UGT5-like [Linepithema humile]|uniref:UDP-glycosyltransferase UGT5-like n=1 Tax=Linepithema humile TaxID=83485 RepID=UPI00351DEC32